MSMPPPDVLAWAGNAVAADGRVIGSSDLPQSRGKGPWRLDVNAGESIVQVVLHLSDPQHAAARRQYATEAAALGLAERHVLAAPRLLATDLDGSVTGHLAILQTALRGSSRIPREPDPTRLRDIGRMTAAIHAVTPTPTPSLPVRLRPLADVDFETLPVPSASADLFVTALRAMVDAATPSEPHCFVHGDLWQGNMLWEGDNHTGTVDWDFAGVGPPGVDLGSIRCDVVVMYGQAAAEEVLAGWEEVQGTRATNVGWWDATAAMCTPPDLGLWLPNFQHQGRHDLDLATVTTRRDAFLAAALGAIG
jgi:aminoglycoside phosphotransferase (APT) family kinase protein